MANLPFTQGFAGGSAGSSKNPSLQFSVPCLEVDDQDQKPPTFKYLFYELPFPEFPFKASFFIANGWCSGQGNYHQSMKLLKPDGSMLVETGQQAVDLQDPNVPFMAVNFFKDLPFEGPGVYKIQVFLGNEKVLEYPLTVRKVDA